LGVERSVTEAPIVVIDESVLSSVEPGDPATLPAPEAGQGETVRVLWSRYDHAYIACCDEFPRLSAMAASWEAALLGIQEKVRVARDGTSAD
jgi:hypothetical protein